MSHLPETDPLKQPTMPAPPVRASRRESSRREPPPPAQPTLPSPPVSGRTLPGQRLRATVTRQMRPVAQPTIPAPAAPPPARHIPLPHPPGGRHHRTPVALPPVALPPIAPARQCPGTGSRLLLAGGLLTAALVAVLCGGLSLLLLSFYSGGILPNIHAGGVALGGLSEVDAAARLQTAWATLTLLDPATGQEWRVNPVQIGITLDATATAARAYQIGRTRGSLLDALRGQTLDPVLNLDLNAFTAGLDALRPEIETPPVNAGVRLVNGIVEATPPQTGRLLDVTATRLALEQGAAARLSAGQLEVVMVSVNPPVLDAAPLVQAASALLTGPLTVRLYDPVTGDIVRQEAPPTRWAAWITADADPASPTGLRLTISEAAVRDFLNETAAQLLDSSRYLKVDQAVSAIQSAVQQNQTTVTVRVYHHDRTHTVQAGETIISIAWDYGVPYPWVEQANPGVSTLGVGQTITIPSADNFFPYEPVPDKRIEVSISQQRVRVYEYGALKWDWAASTGISSSPTWTGVYQIISHVPNAYAANWDLWMPDFMGVYQPIPGADFTNGFHGFPTRGGGQLLWENSLGTRVTYGCILLSNANVSQLYAWAPEGVVVEILP